MVFAVFVVACARPFVAPALTVFAVKNVVFDAVTVAGMPVADTAAPAAVLRPFSTAVFTTVLVVGMAVTAAVTMATATTMPASGTAMPAGTCS